jgi:hypothetical protein
VGCFSRSSISVNKGFKIDPLGNAFFSMRTSS